MKTAVLIPGPPPLSMPPPFFIPEPETQNREWTIGQFVCWDGTNFRRVRGRATQFTAARGFVSPDRRYFEIRNGFTISRSLERPGPLASPLNLFPLSGRPEQDRISGGIRQLRFGRVWQSPDHDLRALVEDEIRRRYDTPFAPIIEAYRSASDFAEVDGRIAVFVGHGLSDPTGGSFFDLAPRYPHSRIRERSGMLTGRRYFTVSNLDINYCNRTVSPNQIADRTVDEERLRIYMDAIEAGTTPLTALQSMHLDLNNRIQLSGDPDDSGVVSGINRLERMAKARTFETLRAILLGREVWMVSCSTGSDRAFCERVKSFLGIRKLLAAKVKVASRRYLLDSVTGMVRSAGAAEPGALLRVYFFLPLDNFDDHIWPGRGSNTEEATRDFPSESFPSWLKLE